MKKIFITIATLLVVVCSFAQKQTARVVLKNGTTITGTIIELKPTSHITLNVAGFETRLEMKDVDTISTEAQQEINNEKPQAERELVSVDPNEPDYPATIKLPVGPCEIELVLVRGGSFAMGYDGSGSVSMNSEPVHDVLLSSFYVTKQRIGKDIASYYLSGGGAFLNSNEVYEVFNWDDCDDVSKKVARLTGIPFDLITEAQWEYIATGEVLFSLDFEVGEFDACRDFYGDYRESRDKQVDPIQKIGNRHVYRSFESSEEIYRRYEGDSFSIGRVPFRKGIRLTVPAREVYRIVENMKPSQGDELDPIYIKTRDVMTKFSWIEEEGCYISSEVSDALWNDIMKSGTPQVNDFKTAKKEKKLNNIIRFVAKFEKLAGKQFMSLAGREEGTFRLKLLDL